MGKNFGSKKKGGRGGRGGGGRGGRGKGRGKGRKKRRAHEEEDEDAPGASAKRSKRQRAGQESEAEEAAPEPQEEVQPAVAPKPSKPGFGALLQAFGVQEDEQEGESEDEDGEEEGEEEGAEGDPAEEAAQQEAGAVEDEVDDGEEDDGLDEEEPAGEPSPGLQPGQDSLGREASFEKVKVDCPDYYEHFWSDPPVSLASGKAAKAAESPEHFALPGLSRCEVRSRKVGALLKYAQSPADAADVWKRCDLWSGLRQQFARLLAEENVEVGAEEGALFLFLHAYLDVSFLQHTHLNARSVRAVCMLHVVDHVMKAYREVAKNDATIRAAREAPVTGRDKNIAADFTVGDQGFTRARVLVLCPFRSACYDLVKMFLALCPRKEVGNQQRFEDEFGSEDAEEPTANDSKPDWSHLFRGNNDDRFRLGVSIQKKSVKLYAPFTKSDVLFCSPIGLRQITGAEGDYKRDFDFLSSIEVCILDRADVLRMQNWEHVQEVMEVVNRKPRSIEGIDISRLRTAFADDRARSFRQTVVTSAGQSLDAEALFSKAASAAGPQEQQQQPTGLAHKLGAGSRGRGRGGRRWGQSLADEEQEDLDQGLSMEVLAKSQATASASSPSCRGFVRLVHPPDGGPLERATNLGVARQFFLHTPCESLKDHNEQLFRTFEEKYWKPLGSSLERLLIVANTYFSFLRLRQFFRDEGTDFGSAFEYTKKKDLVRARARFSHGESRVLLVTERFLWYRRFKLKGADYVLFFGPPETPSIYEDVLGGVRTPSMCNSMCLFTRQDGFALERIAGHERARKMLTSPPLKAFVFN